MQQILVHIKQIYTGFLDLIFPDQCPSCYQALKEPCIPICPMCASKLETVGVDEVRRSINTLPQACDPFEHLFVLWQFDKAGSIQHIHQGLKYKNRPYHGTWLGELLGRTLLLPTHPTQLPDVIIPIPLHRRRFLERGFNQSDMLAAGIAQVTHIPLAKDILERSGYTKTQTGLDREKRFDNVSNAFKVQPSATLQGKHVLLVDDILTTGATLYAASLPLKAAGAALISIAALAMARI